VKDKLISLIVILGIDEKEIFLDIDLEEITFESIEWCKKSNQVILHKFVDDNDYEYNFDELPKKMKYEIYNILLKLSVSC
jgi:hypothetical protein